MPTNTIRQVGKLTYKKGNLFDYLKPSSNIVVAHICNTVGVMGAGFAAEVRTRYPDTDKIYTQFCKDKKLSSPTLYQPTTLWTTEKFGYFANMICQTSLGEEKNAKYSDLSLCMMDVYFEYDLAFSNSKNQEIYCPKFGAGLCGLKWDIIEELIKEIWIDREINVTVFTL